MRLDALGFGVASLRLELGGIANSQAKATCARLRPRLRTNPVVVAPLVGANKKSHIDDAVASLDITLTDDEKAEARCAGISGLAPPGAVVVSDAAETLIRNDFELEAWRTGGGQGGKRADRPLPGAE